MNIILTGGTRGIGKAIAIFLLESGHNLTINYVKSDETAKEMERLYPDNLLTIRGSITDEKANEKLLSSALLRFGSVDVLINNAAISNYGLFEDMNMKEIAEILDTNISGTMNITRMAIPELRKSKGQIINISSIWGHKGASCEAVYAMTKGALNQMTTSLAKELGTCGIRVNTISPGLINTEMNDDLELDDFIDSIPLGRMGEPVEIARLVDFLINTTYINGANIVIDGGYGI